MERKSVYDKLRLKCPLCETQLNWVKNDTVADCPSSTCDYRAPINPIVPKADLDLLLKKLRKMGHRWNGYHLPR